MKYHHICLVTTDMDQSLKLWKDLIGCDVMMDERYDDVGETGDANAGCKGAKMRLGMLKLPGGDMLELNQYFVPEEKKLSREKLGPGYTGIKKVSLEIDDIDGWLKKIKAAGFEIAEEGITELKTPSASFKTFRFYDHEGTMVEFLQQI